MHNLNPKDSSLGRSPRRLKHRALLRAILGLAIGACCFFCPRWPIAAGEGVCLVINRTPHAIALEIISNGRGDDGGRSKSSVQSVLAPHSITIFRCGAGIAARWSRDDARTVDLPLSPENLVVIEGQRPSEVFTFPITGVTDLTDHRLFAPWQDGFCRGYRCSRWPDREITCRIPVKLLVDDDEAAAPALWQARLARRIRSVNEVLIPFCGVFLEIVSFGTWESDAQLTEFEAGFGEFVSKVDPSPAAVAIGFSSQWSKLASPSTLGVSSGPLSRHILLREYGTQITESERVEMLLHELGHYLGAAHVPDENSIMRGHLEKRPARDRYFAIGFDPLNTLIMNTVADELKAGRTDFAVFSLPASNFLRACYGLIRNANPADDTAVRLAGLLPLPADDSLRPVPPELVAGKPPEGTHPVPDRPLPPEPAATLPPPIPDNSDSRNKESATAIVAAPKETPSETIPSAGVAPGGPYGEKPADNLGGREQGPAGARIGEFVAANAIEGARCIVRQIVSTWTHPGPDDIPRTQPVGDFILEDLVCRAAALSRHLAVKTEEDRRGAFLLAIAVLSDDSSLLRNTPGLDTIFHQIESAEERKQRLIRVGISTIYARHDWAQHFCVSAALVHVLGPGPAKSLGLAKEWRDSQGDSGWSFADLAANLAGIRFAQAVLAGEISLEAVETGFQIVKFVPPLMGYDENIGFRTFVSSYGGLFGERTRSITAEIERAIEKLPAYRPSPTN
ncbi:MAG: hypothetical protein ACUVQG_10865 [Thermogutta sp.]